MSCERSNQQVLIRDSPGSLTWPTQTKKFLPKKFLIITPPPPPHPQPLSKNQTKKFFKQKNFHICLNQPISYPKKKYLILTRKSRVVKTLLCKCVLNSAVYFLQTYKRVLIKINSHSLFGTAVIFSSFIIFFLLS